MTIKKDSLSDGEERRLRILQVFEIVARYVNRVNRQMILHLFPLLSILHALYLLQYHR